MPRVVGPLVGRCVEVLVQRGGETGYGSGLRLATSLVVTAGHVVDGGTLIKVRLSGGSSDEITVDGWTAWRGDRVDIAFVELSPGAGLDEVAPMAVGAVPEETGGRLPFTAIGYPRHQTWRDAGTGMWRDSDQIDGVIPLGSSVKRGRLVLHRADGRALEARDWSGFSGAAVVCGQAAVGVVVESAHSGGLEAVRLASAIGTYEPRADDEREPAPSAAAARALLAGHGVTPQPVGVHSPGEPRRPAYDALLRQYAARCPELIGREQELAGLMAFATGREPYLLLVAPPWAGKTSLATHFATGSHPQVDVVSFVVSRRDGQMRVQQFHRAVCEQLAVLLGEFPPAEPDAAAFLSLWERAMAHQERRGRALILMVDGLDENDHRELAEPSIASQLPADVGAAAHVLVTSRHAGVPLDVDENHPLRACRRHVLAPFPAARSLLLRARQELDHVLTEPLPRRILTTMAVAHGALSIGDIAAVNSDDRLAVRRTLERSLSRVVEPRPGPVTRYTPAHDTLAAAVREDLEQEEVARARAAVDAWALGFAEAGWPDATPGYLTEAYPTLLLTEGAGRTLAALASPERRDLLRRRTGGDFAALAELSNAARLLAAAPDPDLTTLARVSLLRERIHDETRDVPASYPLLLARLGRPEEGVQLARTLQNSYTRADALLAIADRLFGSQPVEARNLVLEAMAVPGRLDAERVDHTVRAALVLARHGEPDATELARTAIAGHVRGLPGDLRVWSIVTVAEPMAEIDPALARTLIEEAIDQADAEDRPAVYGGLARASGLLGRTDHLLRHIADLDRDGRKEALLQACDDHFAGGGRRAVPETLIAELNREFSEAELVRSAPYQDEERASRMLATVPGDAYALTWTALAAHGRDPRRSEIPPDVDLDDLLSDAAKAARNNGHLALAASLGREIADPATRADTLTETSLAILDTGSPQDADPLVREVSAALGETPGRWRAGVLAALARAADSAGREELAGAALEAAVRAALDGVDDWQAQWQATHVAGVAACLGRVEHTLAIAAALQDEMHRLDTLLHAADAVKTDDRRSSALRTLVDLAVEGVEGSEHPRGQGWPARVVGDLAGLLLDTGDVDEALRLATYLDEADVRARALLMRAHVLSDDLSRAASLIRETGRHAPAGAPAEAVRRQEQAAAMIVQLCDAGHRALARELTTELIGAADMSLTPAEDVWSRPWLTAACHATGLDREYAELLATARHASLVTGSLSATSTMPMEAVIRLRLWDRYRDEARRMNDVLADSALTELVTAMLGAGLVREAVTVIDDLTEDAAYCAALAARSALATDHRLARDLVGRSLAAGFESEVIAPLAALEPRCLDEIAAQLGVGASPATTPPHEGRPG
ncbi:hypothetical protein FH608_016490 [Nonomuraea phyllanthi]|uniref:Uncharacterized protein n=1 Tax=Nonomuraea phyllanthi TaxID=2219224 RepID=A0A5C4WKG6_9ACTN|nr:serine protease [Nonomuraea phyllanthi]KAB8194770.1 hypothetical protein FH608_016490 [Nonomuraea phyllanthi]